MSIWSLQMDMMKFSYENVQLLLQTCTLWYTTDTCMLQESNNIAVIQLCAHETRTVKTLVT